MYPDHQHVLVVRSVEHPDVTGRGQRPANPPQVVVLAFFLGGHAEAGVPDALRISGSDNVFDDPALAGGVHALQHQQQRAVVVGGPAVGVEHLLQFAKRSLRSGASWAASFLLPLNPGVALVSSPDTLSPASEHQVVVRLVGPELGSIAMTWSSCRQHAGGSIGDGCGSSTLNFSSDPPTSTMPHNALHDSIVR